MAIDATHDPDVLRISALAVLPSIGRAGFGLVLLLGLNASTGALIQSFDGPRAAASAATAGTITTAQKEYIEAAYAQAVKPRAILVCRRAADVAQVQDFVIDAGAADGDYVIIIDGTTYTYTASSDTAGDIATALAALVNANPNVGAVVVTSTTVRVTASAVGGAFDFSSSSTGSPIVESGAVAAVNVKTVLDAALVERDDWYGVALESRDDLDNARLAEWALTNERFGGAQSNSAALLTSGADWSTPYADNPNILIGYRANNASRAVFLWLVYKLSANLDRQTTAWSLCPLRGEAADNLTSTQKSNLLTKNIGVYLPLRGVACWRAGKMRSGLYADERTTLDWVLARIKENTAQAMIDASVINDKIPFDDDGFAQLEAVGLAVIQQGERIGHIRPGTGRLRYDRIDDLSDDDVTNRRATFRYGGAFGGAIEEVEGVGYFSRDDDFITQLFDTADAVIGS